MGIMNGKAFQLGYFVDDLERAMADWRSRFPIGPFYLLENIKMERAVYRGKPFELELTAALAQAGSIQIELIYQHSPGPSALKDTSRGGACEFNHMGFLTENFDSDLGTLIAAGHEVAMQGVALGTVPFAYVDTVSTVGHMIELVPAIPDIVRLFDEVAMAARDWHGRDPIRRY